MLKRVLILLILFVVLGLNRVSLVLAKTVPTDQNTQVGQEQAPPYMPDPVSVTENLGDCDNSWSSVCNISHVEGVLESVIGVKITGAQTKEGKPVASGAIGFFASNIGVMASTPPASSGDYVKYMASRLQVPGTPQVAYAAVGPGGLGFTSLTPVLELWTAVRNLAYIVFAVFFIVVALMIMFRVKIDPKTAANIQNALPKIIIALILVTFSYAMAGFLVDIMYVVIALLLTIIKTIGGFGSYPADFERCVLSGQTIFHFFFGGLNCPFNGANLSLKSFEAINEITTQFVQNGPLAGAGGVLGFAFGSVAFLVVAVAILWALFKTWLTLLGAYVTIILTIIFSPFLLMLDAIPGRNMLGMWIRMMLSNLLAFPLVIGMMFVGLALGGGYGSSFNPKSGFVPPLIGGNSQTAIQALIGIGVLLTIPKALAILQEILKAPAFKYGTAWLDAIKFGARPELAVGGGAYKDWWRKNLEPDILAEEVLRNEYAKFLAGVAPNPYTNLKAKGLPVPRRPFLSRILPTPKCLSYRTLIATPLGEIRVEKVTVGMLVWTQDKRGQRIAAQVLQTSRVAVSSGHQSVDLALDDGRRLLVSPGHPTGEYNDVSKLQIGDQYDGARIVSNKLIHYTHAATFDLLPGGDTGNYWANGVLLGSTLKKGIIPSLHQYFKQQFLHL